MLDLTSEQRMLVKSVTELAEDNFSEKAFGWDGDLPWENIDMLADRGFLGINFDVEYGGGGMTEFEAMLMLEAVGRVCPDTSEFLLNQHFVGGRAIDMFGSPEAKEKYLRPVAEGNAHTVIAMSEPGAGSDITALETTVEERGDEYVVNGEKIWTSELPNASVAVTWVKFPDEGLGTVLLDLDADGIDVQQHYTNMSGRPQSQFHIENVVIPKENVLTRGRDAFKEQLKSLNWERLGVAAQSTSAALAAFDQALDYAQDREQFDQPIGEFQGMEWKLADMAKRIEASRALNYRAAQNAVDVGRVPDPLETSIAKLYSAEMAEDVVSEALQVFGANGYQQGHPLEYLYRTVRGYRIAGGTDEIMKNTIAGLIKNDGLPTLTDT
jgi:alkylation response protein AidB-like acyl-CoA dehydrogenase